MNKRKVARRPSVERPWMKYYPEPLRKMAVPECTLQEYLRQNCPGDDMAAMDLYGSQILWSTVFEQADVVARALKAVGFGEGDQIPVFLASVPEFIYLLLGAEQIGASLLCRDNTLEENVEAVRKAGAKVMIAHDWLAQYELEKYLSDSAVERVILLDTCHSCNREELPDYIRKNLERRYPEEKAHGSAVTDWDDFLALGKSYDREVAAAVDVNRPLFRAYTSGSTDLSKQGSIPHTVW